MPNRLIEVINSLISLNIITARCNFLRFFLLSQALAGNLRAEVARIQALAGNLRAEVARIPDKPAEIKMM